MTMLRFLRRALLPPPKDELDQLNKSSRFNLLFMKRANLLSIGIFVLALLIYVVRKLFFS